MNISSRLISPEHVGYWGPVTATLDWCEANYQFTHYIAELANTLSNIITVGLAVHGIKVVRSQELPSRFLAGFLAFALVGIGSFAFHATLLFSAQLADELPMIVTASCSFFVLFDTSPDFNIRESRALLSTMIAFNVLFSISYWLYRNPVYHQVVFAALMLAISARGVWLLHWSEKARNIDAKTKSDIGNLYLSGSGSFALGFAIWNLDNIFCETLTDWKLLVHWPAAFLLEGHSWWHILTGTGSYLMWMGTIYLTLSTKDDPKKYTLGHNLGYIPYVRRVEKLKAF